MPFVPDADVMGSAVRYAPAFLRAVMGSTIPVAGVRVEIPGSLAIRASVLGGNLRVHRAIAQVLRSGDTFVDVGANIGYNALFAARIVGPAGRVVALEPAGDNFAVLQRNIQRNGLGGIEALKIAAGARTETRRFFLRGDVSAVNSLYADSCYAEVTATADVEVRRLDDIAGSTARLVKIDVEGAELEVLDGMPALMASPETSLIVEWHAALQELAGFPPDRLPRLLLERGFVVDALWHTRRERLTEDGITAVCRELLSSRGSIELFAVRPR